MVHCESAIEVKRKNNDRPVLFQTLLAILESPTPAPALAPVAAAAYAILAPSY